MTICIAVLCENNQAVVIASDRMITAGFLAMEFEHSRSKIDQITPAVVGLTAGDALANTELFRECKATIQQLQSPSVQLIVDRIKSQFVILRQQRAEDSFLRPRGITFEEFYKKGGIQRIPPDLAMVLDREIMHSAFPLNLVVAGVDASGAHIYGVRDPGIVSCYDSLGFHAVGSGESHALLTLIGLGQNTTDDIKKSVYQIYEAKRKAEVAQGVGRDTDVGIINAAGLRVLSEDEMASLSRIYSDKMSPQLEHIQEAIANLTFVNQEGEADDEE